MKANKLWFENDRIYIRTESGRVLWQSLLYYRRLREATDEQRAHFEMDDEGIHWLELDEDVSLESFEYENPEPHGVSRLFLSHPELNPTAIAHRLNIEKGVMRQYVNGTLTPSPEIEQRIYAEFSLLTSELLNDIPARGAEVVVG